MTADGDGLEIRDLVRILNGNVGPTLVQTMTGTKDHGLPAKWATADGPMPGSTAVEQLRLGYRVWHLLSEAEGRNVALAWLVGANHRLGATPVSAVRDLRSAEVIGAARAFIDGSAPA